VERILNIMSQYALNSNMSAAVNPNLNASSSTLGSHTSLSLESTNALSLGVIMGAGIVGNSCVENAIAGFEEVLSALVLDLNTFDTLHQN
jgi:hypothetical protein